MIAAGPRVDAENTIIGLADRGVRSSVVRLPPVVHSTLDKHGFVPTLIAGARAAGRSGYLGDGANRWPAGRTLGAGRLDRLALEEAPQGSRLHAVGDQGVPVRQIAQTIGRHLGVPTSTIPAEQAEAQFGWLAPASSPTLTRVTTSQQRDLCSRVATRQPPRASWSTRRTLPDAQLARRVGAALPGERGAGAAAADRVGVDDQ